MKSKFYTTPALIIGIIIVINLLANEYHVRLDLTEDKQYTLSKATKNIIESLEEPVTVKAYFSTDLPPNIIKTRQDFQDLLIEYANRSDGQVLYEFINPNETETYEQEATNSGIRPVLINVREKDQVKQQKAFLGALVQLGEKKEVIPFVQPGAAMEYALTTAIKKISIDNKPKIAFMQGHGEPSLNQLTQANEQLSVLYEPTLITLTDSFKIPDDIKTIVIIAPTDSFPSSHLAQLDVFLGRGGKLLVALNTVQASLQYMYGEARHTGIEKWLKQKGVEIKDNLIIDASCGSISIPQQIGGLSFQSNLSFPYVPVIGTFANHSITNGLESVMLQFVSEVNFVGDTTKKFTPLAFSSGMSGRLGAPVMIDINHQWTENDFTQKNIVVAAALEGQFAADQVSKIVVIGDGDFIVNGEGQQARQLQPDNINLFSNAVDWLSDDTGLIDLRTKGAVTRPIHELDDTTKTILKYTNFLLPVLLVIVYGIIRAQKNRLTRSRRMHENYETV